MKYKMHHEHFLKIYAQIYFLNTVKFSSPTVNNAQE